MLRSLAVALLALLTAAAAGAAEEPAIENLTALANGPKVSVRFSLANALSSGEMRQALESGLPTSLTYVIEIYRDRPNWFNSGVGRARIEVICTFNSVTREYLLNYRRDRKLVRSETFTDLTALMERMTRIEERDLFDIGDRRHYKLNVRVRADLARGWFLYVIPWDVSTRWKKTRVRTAAEES